MKIEIGKKDFVTLAVLASCADLPDEEREYEKTVSGILHSLDKDVAAEIAGEMLALKVKIELLNGTSAEDVLKTVLECVMEEDDEELDLDENDGDALKRLKRMMEEEDEWIKQSK